MGEEIRIYVGDIARYNNGILHGVWIDATLRLPVIAIEMIKKSMLKQGYGSREQSRWVSEAVEQLVNKKGFWDLVAEEFNFEGSNKPTPHHRGWGGSGILTQLSWLVLASIARGRSPLGSGNVCRSPRTQVHAPCGLATFIGLCWR